MVRVSVPSDNPIVEPKDDSLSRRSAAETFARQVLSIEASRGAVVGVLGQWGSGKTSFINLSRAQFKEQGVPVLDFNPWMFSGAEQLVESFFIEVAAQLRLRRDLADIGNDLADYGEAFAGLGWVPLVGPWIERGRGAARVLGKLLKRRREGSQGRREKLEAALSGLDHPIVVVLDDIDRLSTPEIRDVFKLVRLTASFPNIIYLLAFDRARVEQALTEDGVPGRDYLEKILQVAFDLPAIPQTILDRQVFAALSSTLEGTNPAGLDEAVWPDVFAEVIRPLVRNMRDVRRYQAAVHGTLVELEDRVALADLLAVEAIRVFLPDVFHKLGVSIDALCTPSSAFVGGREESDHLKQAIEDLIELGGVHEEVVRSLIKRLFPFASRHMPGGSHYSSEWSNPFLRERRIGHESILRLYMERVAGEELLSFYAGEHAWKLLDDREALDSFLRSIEPAQQEGVIAALRAYEDEFKPEQVVPGAVVIWNLAHELPERERGMFDFGPRTTVLRFSHRLLNSLGDEEATEKAAREILPQLTTLSAKREVIFQIGYHEGAGHKLVSEEAAAQIEGEWRQEVRDSTPADLAREHDLVRVIYWANKGRGEGEDAILIPDDPHVTLAALKSARTETRSGQMGQRAVTKTSVFAWDSLVDVFGGESILVTRIQALKESGVKMEDDLEELIEKYLGGWRPRDFDLGEDEDDE